MSPLSATLHECPTASWSSLKCTADLQRAGTHHDACLSLRQLRWRFREFAGVADILAVNLGTEILKIVPGRVSTEVDAHLSYDTQALIDKVSVSYAPRISES